MNYIFLVVEKTGYWGPERGGGGGGEPVQISGVQAVRKGVRSPTILCTFK